MVIWGRANLSSPNTFMKNKVCIAVPTRSGNIYFELAMRLMSWANQKTIPTMIMIEPFSAPVDHARNQIVKRFLSTDCTHLMMIDDDIVPPVDALERLLFHDKEIVAAACPMIGPDKKGKLVVSYNAYTMDENDISRPLLDGNGLAEVDAVGTGCIMIKREVLENMHAVAPFLTRYDDATGIKYMGEDIYFCKLASDMIIDIYSDFKLKCKHIKSCNLLEL